MKFPVFILSMTAVFVFSFLFFFYTIPDNQNTDLTAQAQDLSEKPNIVIFMTDDQDFASLPVMRKLLSYPYGSWVNFTEAHTNDSICCPARATLLTGQYSHNHNVIRNGYGNDLDTTNTLAVWLDNAGYDTSLFGKYQNGFPWRLGRKYKPEGWDTFYGKGGLTDKISGLAIKHIENLEGDQPFFMVISPVDPHWKARPGKYKKADVYIPPVPPSYNEEDVSDKPKWIRDLGPIKKSHQKKWAAERVNHQKALLNVDDDVLEVLDALEAKGELDNTMFIFMSDHGFSWGEHRWIKKHCPYEECNKIPMLVRFPGHEGNREENRLISNVDIAVTIADYAGVTPTLDVDGKSFLPLLEQEDVEWEEAVLLERFEDKRVTDGYFGVRVPGWTYVEYEEGDKELYDLENDPYQLENKANQPGYLAIQSQLAQKMRELRGW